MTKKKLNLLQLTTGGAAQSGTTSAEVMRCEFRDADLCAEFLDDMPDKLFCYSVAPGSASATDTTEEMPGFNVRSLCPFAQLRIHPIWNGNGSNVASLSSQIHDCPMPSRCCK